MSGNTFAQAILEGAVAAAGTEAGQQELKGHSRDQFVAAVRALTEGMDTLEQSTSMHIMLLAVTYIRNVIIVAMRENQRVLETQQEGSA